MLAKRVNFPSSKRIKDVNDIKNWIEAWEKMFELLYLRMVYEIEEMERLIIKGDDNKHIHGFLTRKDDFKL